MTKSSIVDKLFSLSPYIEVFIRRVYWRNIAFFVRFKNKRRVQPDPAELSVVDFGRILANLKSLGVQSGDLLLVHSAYDSLKNTRLSSAQIVNELIGLVGPAGTLAMPAMPIFRNDVDRSDYLSADISDRVYVYDRKKSRIKTGALPTALAKLPGAVRSLHPINTMVAAGRLAEDLMKDNLTGEFPLPCGVNSSWNHCVENDAWVLGLGVDLAHSLTMIHVAEDVLDEKWPVKGWYRHKHFEIIDGDLKIQKTLRERHPKWGTLCYAERTLCKDLIRCGIMKSVRVDGVLIELLRAKSLIDFLMSKNGNGYPYFRLKI